MSSFKWEVYEASEEPVPQENGGEVELKQIEEVNAVEAWKIETADQSLIIVPVSGGIIEKIGKLENKNIETASDKWLKPLTADKGLFRFVVIVILLLLFIVTINDVWHGNLSFTTFVYLLSAFMAAKVYEKSNKNNEDSS
jgi:hypothetical protein